MKCIESAASPERAMIFASPDFNALAAMHQFVGIFLVAENPGRASHEGCLLLPQDPDVA